jgi:DNA primase
MAWLDDLVSHARTQLDERVLEALAARGVTDAQVERYRLGYLNQELPELEYPERFLEWSKRDPKSKPGSKLDDVLVLPLTNTLGHIKGLQFRHVERDRSGYMDFMGDRGEIVLFGLAEAIPAIWQTRSVFLVEGAFDLFPVQRCVSQTVATLTARVSEPFLRVLHRLVDEIWLGYDMDETGRKACERFVDNHGSEFQRVRIIKYPQVQLIGGKLAKDPGDLWEAWGDAQFVPFLKSALVTSKEETPHGKSLQRRRVR